MKKQCVGNFSMGDQFSIIVFWSPGHFSTRVNILSDTGTKSTPILSAIGPSKLHGDSVSYVHSGT